LAERLSAEITAVRFFTGVCISVLSHVRLLMEALSAVRASKRADVCVNHHVGGKGGGPFKRLAAYLARVLAVRQFPI